MESSDSDAVTSKKTFKCSILGCSAVFSNNKKLVIHIRKHTGERPFVCDEPGCDKTYTNSSHLRRHKKLSHGEKVIETVTCDHDGCGAVLANKYSLKKHYNRKHNPELYPFKCGECSQGFHRKKQLQHHIYLHTGQAMFSCDKCDMSFVTTYSLNKHKRYHRVYTCDCGETFHRWSLILSHKKMCKKFCFTCDICDKNFSQLGNFQNHKLIHIERSERVTFKCPYLNCERLYFYKKNLNYHIANFHKKVQPNEVFKCSYPKCQVLLKTKLSQRRHMQTHFKFKIQKKREVRRDKGKPKKSMVSVLLGEKLQLDDEIPATNEILLDDKTQNEIPVTYENEVEQDDPLLKQCDKTLNLLHERIVAAN